MTKKLEELFNLPEKETVLDHTDVKSVEDSIKAV